jgi:hypothetical protein
VSRIVGQDKPDILTMIHSGVKGMKWGVRKKTSTSSEIKDARVRQAVRERRLASATDQLNLVSAGSNAAAKKAAVKKFQQAHKDLLTSEDRVVAARMTKGDKWLQVFALGPLAAVTIPALALHAKAVEKNVDKQRQSG